MGENCCHGCHDCHDYSKINRNRIKIAFLIVLFVMVAEFIGGFLSNSISLISDAGHMSVDAVALGIAYWASGRKTMEKYAALINGLILLVMSAFIVISAVSRIYNPEQVICLTMLIVAIVGLVANIAQIMVLHKGDRNNINMRAAYLHVLSDAACSVAVIIGALSIYFTGISIIDPIIGCFIAVLIFIGAVRLIKDAANLFREKGGVS